MKSTPDTDTGHRRFAIMAIVAVMAMGAPTIVAAQGTEPSTRSIVSQPARDVGIEKTQIPPLLVEVSKNPYSTAGAGSCPQIASSIAALTRVIGPDFSTSPAVNKQNMAKLGGSVVVNSLIPFRGIVREVSGASAADRRKNAAIDAGIARRGFLRGLQLSRKCRG
jgi:hypothetical protein